jgi:uncharacterized protein YkwD
MSCNQSIKTQKIILACYSVIIAFMIIVSTPALAKANNRSTDFSLTMNQERHAAVEASMATLKQVITGSNYADNLQRVALSAAETQMISLINQERAKAGLKGLIIDDSLVKLAKEKSMDMVSYNYFGHISNRLGTLYDQLQRNQIVYQFAAENLAGAASIQKAQRYFLTSPYHRCNILNPRFTKVGVGVVRGGPFGSMITQLFLG